MIFYRVKATIEQKNEVQEESQERERRTSSRQRAEMICAETTVFNSVFDEKYIFTVSVHKTRINMNVISKEPISELYIQQYLSTIEMQSTEIQMEEVTWREIYTSICTACRAGFLEDEDFMFKQLKLTRVREFHNCDDNVSDDMEYADLLLDDIQLSAELLHENKHSVLTIFWLPKSNHKAKNMLFSHVENCTFVEIKEDIAFGREAKNYLKDKALEQHVEADDTLFSEIKDSKTGFAPSDLNRLFDNWFDEHLKNEKYPQYASIDSVKKANAKQKPRGNAYEELQKMIGLKKAKSIIDEALNYYKAQKLFCDKGLQEEHLSMHMVFTGNPGTAKTTVARLFAQIMKDNGILSEGTLHEVGRADLVGKYVGWTAQMVKDKFKKAKGGVLFIDEAYSLLDDKAGMYGDEAINTIVQEMENNREDMVVIFAGYPQEMEEFLSRNPGLRSRIAWLACIMDMKIFQKSGLILFKNENGLRKCVMLNSVPIKQVVSDTIEQIKERKENERGIAGLQTGFIDLDWKTTGLHKGDFILLAGRPSMGCTSLMLQIANQVATYQQKRVLYFHLELPKEIVAKRLISQEAMVEYADLLKGKLTESEWAKVFKGAERIKHSQLIIDDTPLLSIRELQEKCREYQKEQKAELIIIDYIQLLRGIECGKKLSRKQELEIIAQGLRELAIELNIPIIAISTLPRSVERRPDHRPTLRDLDENVSLAREADIVLFLYRDAYYHFNTDFKDIAEITVARNRYGECGIVQLKWISKCMKYENRN